jgi:hypothetical protein
MWRPIKTSVRAAAKRAPEQEKHPATSPVLLKINFTCFHNKPDFARKCKTEPLSVLL